jgi:hypothetical protein
LQIAPLGLVNRLFHHEHPFAQLLEQTTGRLARGVFQERINLTRLIQARLHNADQLTIRLF